MDIEEQRQGAVTVLRPVGPLVQGEVEQFRARAREVSTRSLGRLVMDASGIPYVDSLGLEALVGASDDLSAGGRALRVAGAGETLREVLDLTGLADRFEFYEDVHTAVRSFL
ncbi:MAG: STAS domain-containing protein [Planctomycetota bacterium]|nr:STAS domain-containing protein [Planctomycetota bacterium]